jgi:hypothetical protein
MKGFENIHYQCRRCGSYDTKFDCLDWINTRYKDAGKTSYWICCTCGLRFRFDYLKNFIPIIHKTLGRCLDRTINQDDKGE